MDRTGVLLIVVSVLLLVSVVFLVVLLIRKKGGADNKSTSNDKYAENGPRVDNYVQPFTVIKNTSTGREQDSRFHENVERHTVQLNAASINPSFGGGFANESEKTAILGGGSFSQVNPSYGAGNITVQYYKNGATKSFRIDGGCTVIGREPGCDIILDSDSHISKQHALIIARNGMPCIADLNSKNGTYVNEQRVEGIVSLRGNESIKLASTEIKVYVN